MISLTVRHEADNNIADIWDPREGESTFFCLKTLNQCFLKKDIPKHSLFLLNVLVL